VEIPAGWFEDPWNQADLRWWNGEQWTGHTSDSPCGSAMSRAATAQPTTVGLEHLISHGGRIAVMDVETTGVYSTDRIVEIAILTLDCEGSVTDEFETLVQPMRDVGATWIHGIEAGMVRDAPTFGDVAHHVASRLDGAIVVGHNVRFDMRMVGKELNAAGIDIDWGLGLDTLQAARCKLAQACAEHGIDLEDAHSAIGDARATARLLFATRDFYDVGCIPAIARPLHVTPLRVCLREGHIDVQPPAPYLAALARGVHTSADVAPYVQLLDVAMADLRLTSDERAELHVLANDLGLDERAIARAHREFINGLIDAALDDQLVTDEEHDNLCRAAALLDVDVERVMNRTDPFRAMVADTKLTAGTSVCFTGQGSIDGKLVDRESQENLARQYGLVVAKSVTMKGPDLVVAADGDSRSTKARRARQLGIPVCTFSEFVHALDNGTVVKSSRVASSGVALVCVECGSSWMAPRRTARPVCVDCSRKALLERKRLRIDCAPNDSKPISDLAAVVVLFCIDCGTQWERPRMRGRRPVKCPDCLAKEA
jgi:DNA polymerase-3 subunit epsilon